MWNLPSAFHPFPGEAVGNSVRCAQPKRLSWAWWHLSSPAQHVNEGDAWKVRQVGQDKSVSLQRTKNTFQCTCSGWVLTLGAGSWTQSPFKTGSGSCSGCCGRCLITSFLWCNFYLQFCQSVSQSMYWQLWILTKKVLYVIGATGFSSTELWSSLVMWMWTLWKK